MRAPPARATIRTFWRRLVGALAGLALLVTHPASGGPSEHAVKAAFVFNFANFVEWPPEALNGQAGVFPVCVSRAASELNGALLALDGKAVQGRTMQIRRYSRNDDIRACLIIVVDDIETLQSVEFRRRLAGAPVLTVGEVEGFAESGGMIGLFVADSRVQFEVNASAFQRTQLRASSHLMRLGRVVRER